jgi:hypothetical protein
MSKDNINTMRRNIRVLRIKPWVLWFDFIIGFIFGIIVGLLYSPYTLY